MAYNTIVKKGIMNMIYYLEDDFTAIPNKNRLIRHEDGKFIERYDFGLGRWVNDSEMLKIYTGEIDVNEISEDEANKEIKRRGRFS